MTHDTPTCCQAFSSGVDNTCFNDFGLSRPGIKARSPTCKAKALPMRHPARDQSPISHMQGESSTYETPRPGIKARSPTCKAKALPMRHRGSIT